MDQLFLQIGVGLSQPTDHGEKEENEQNQQLKIIKKCHFIHFLVQNHQNDGENHSRICHISQESHHLPVHVALDQIRYDGIEMGLSTKQYLTSFTTLI
jgi:hypothetical protein